MSRLRFLLASSFLLVAALSRAETTRYTINLLGSKVGQNIFETQPDGRFKSTTNLEIASTKIESNLLGVTKEGKVVAFDFTQTAGIGSAGAQRMIAVWDGTKVKIDAGETTREQEEKLESGALFANFHPALCATIVRAMRRDQGGPQKIETLLLDGAARFPVTIERQPDRTAVLNGVATPLDAYKMTIGGVEAFCLMAPDGQVAGIDVPAQKFQEIREGYEDAFKDPVLAYKELSQPSHTVKIEARVFAPMRDGLKLAADVVRPAAEGRYPVILTRSPYGRAMGTAVGGWFASRGYVFVSQDVRGRGDSEGDWDPFVNERKDGYDTIEWISKQPWCDGNVGMIGASYGGLVQWSAAVERHPALKCIIPQVSPPDAMTNIPYDHGVPMLLSGLWWASVVKDRSTNPSSLVISIKNPAGLMALPLTKVDDEALGQNIPFFDKWFERDTMAEWKGFDTLSQLGVVKIPALHISGWWDGDGIGTRLNWQAMRKAGNKNQWLIYGPWSHAFNSSSTFADQDYGPGAILELDSLYLRWFDTWLKGKDVGLDKVPRVRAFVTGANAWRELGDWPAPEASPQTLYLSAPSPANGPMGGGELANRPVEGQEPSRYTYNPAAVEIPDEKTFSMDDAKTIVELKKEDQDALVFKTQPLAEPLTITGPISVDLHFSTSARDADFFAMLVDIDEKGVIRMVGMPGKIRASYLSGFHNPKPVKPGKIMRAEIPVWDTAHEFKKGHRLGLIILSDMFPAFARNLGTGEPVATATRMVTAHHTIYHDAKRPSALRLYILPAKR